MPRDQGTDKIDIFAIGDNFNLGVVYDDAALSVADRMKSIWLELRTPRLKEMKKMILDFGIQEIDYFDKSNFYFQPPGGQVFRLISDDEDMLK